ncbi:MAG TPA: DUF72 domain-containing protein [Acidimicrobiia bacterium]|nr:DUF72 domain-containing protein [Acidimicrobiia bacterium]
MIRIGVSGWSYQHWRGLFYPADLPARSQLDYVIEKFNTVEINRTFYSLGRPSWYRSWYDKAPDNYRYAIKGSRFITHLKSLRDVDVPLANFFASGPIELRAKLGPVLWQLPAERDPGMEAIEKFLALLPTSLGEMGRRASHHQLKGEASTKPAIHGHAVRHALELRHRPKYFDSLLELLTARGVALVVSHSSRWPCFEHHTTDFDYVRLHGPGALYASAYPTTQLEEWASKVLRWSGETDRPSQGARDVYVYFDNDGHAYAPRQAEQLASLIAGSSDGKRAAYG